MPGTGAIVGIAVGSAIASVVILTFLTHFLRMWLRGPSSGTDNRKRLDGKVVAITGKRNLSSNHRSRWSIFCKSHGGWKLYLWRPIHSIDLTKLVILHDYKHHRMLCKALWPRQKLPKSDFQSKFSMPKIIQIFLIFLSSLRAYCLLK